jgi:hypothetical protein
MTPTERRKKAFYELVEYNRKLEEQVLQAKTELTNLAAGLVDAGLSDEWGSDTKTRYSAARGLVRVTNKGSKSPSLGW